MQNQKAISVSKGTEIMLNMVQSDLFPTLDKIRKLLIDVQKSKTRFWIYSPELNKLQAEYADISIKFFDIARKLETPDILFEGLEHNTQDIASYFQFEQAISKNIHDGSRYVEIIDRALDRKSGNIQSARTELLALIAILIGALPLF